MEDLGQLQKQADLLRNASKSKQAILLYREIYNRADKSKDYEISGHALQMIGVCYKIENNTKLALSSLKKASKYYYKHGFTESVGDCLRDIGITYEYIGRLASARLNMESALSYLNEQSAGYGITLVKLGMVSTKQKKYSEARDELIRAIAILEKTENWFFLASAYLTLGGLYLATKNYSQALIALEKSKKIFEKHRTDEPQERRFAQLNAALANAYANLGEVEKAKTHLQGCLNFLISKDVSIEAAKATVRNVKLSETINLLFG